MITAISNLNEVGIPDSGKANTFVEYRGLSTDTKPSANNGDVFLEINTSKVYMYNGSTSGWVEL